MSVDLLPCPFCNDPMQMHFDVFRHVDQGTCVIGAYAWPESRLNDWNRRAATSPAGDLAATLEAVLAEHDADRADDAANAADQGERPDLWEDEITIATHLIREAAQALRYQSTGVTGEDVGELRQKLKLAEETLEFVHRWTWGKQHSPLGAAERLSAIKHHPCVAALSAQERG